MTHKREKKEDRWECEVKRKRRSTDDSPERGEHRHKRWKDENITRYKILLREHILSQTWGNRVTWERSKMHPTLIFHGDISLTTITVVNIVHERRHDHLSLLCKKMLNGILTDSPLKKSYGKSDAERKKGQKREKSPYLLIRGENQERDIKMRRIIMIIKTASSLSFLLSHSVLLILPCLLLRLVQEAPWLTRHDLKAWKGGKGRERNPAPTGSSKREERETRRKKRSFSPFLSFFPSTLLLFFSLSSSGWGFFSLFLIIII